MLGLFALLVLLGLALLVVVFEFRDVWDAIGFVLALALARWAADCIASVLGVQ